MIRFFSEKEVYGELSNFYKLNIPISFNGKTFITSEHLYQCMKYMYQGAPPDNDEYVDIICKCETPYQAKILANKSISYQYEWRIKLNNIINKYKDRVKIRSDWDQIKKDVMYEVLKMKFKSDFHCYQVLVGTSPCQLIESSPYDSYWGIGNDNKGKNILGELLTKLRDEIVNIN